MLVDKIFAKIMIVFFRVVSIAVAIGTTVWSIFWADAYEWGSLSRGEFDNGLVWLLVGFGIALLLWGFAALMGWLFKDEIEGEE